MKPIRLIAAALLLVAPSLHAQRATAFELGAFLQFSKYDDFTGLKNGVGAGGRFGVYFLRNLALEYEADFTKTRSSRLGDLTALNNRIDAIYYVPVSTRLRLLLGGGWTGTQYHTDTTKNQFDSGLNAVVGLKYCVNENWAIRTDVNADFKDPSDQTLAGERTRTYNFRVGFSRFLGGRAKNSPCFEREEAPARAPAPVPAPVAAPVPAPAPPPPPAARVTLSASPSSIMAGRASTLQWNATNATSCGAPWMNDGTTSGSQSVSPQTTTRYEITCTGAGGSGTTSATVTVTQPAPVAAPAPVPVRHELMTLHGTHFKFDSSSLTVAAKDTLQEVVATLKLHADAKVEIQGHTDAIGSDAYNQALSERRANSVKAYLVSQGIAEGRITTRGFGESQPVADNSTAAGRRENRRVVIIEIQ